MPSKGTTQRQATLSFAPGSTLVLAGGQSGKKRARDAPEVSPGAVPVGEGDLIDLTHDDEALPASSAAASAGNALAAMMQRAKEGAPKEDFVCCFLGSDPLTGHWDWAWGAAGSVPLGGLPALRRVQLKLNAAADKPTAVSLYSNVPSFSPQGMPVGPAPVRPLGADPACRLSPSLLKSCLQKAVRRGLVDSALQLAAELWARGPVDALRRLLIIIVEDTVLHPAYPALAFFMMLGGEDYQLGPLHASCYLLVVRDICLCAARDPVPATPSVASLAAAPAAAAAAEGGQEGTAWLLPPPTGVGGAISLTAAQLAELGAGPAALLRSLLARALYGGMAGDTAMLRAACALWACRFAHDAVARRAKAAAAAALGGGSAGAVPPWLHAFAPPAGARSWASQLAASHRAKLAATSFHGPFTLQLLLTPRVALGSVPLAGVDNHCSDIVEEVLRQGGAFGGGGSSSSSSSSGGSSSGSLTAAVSEAVRLLVCEDGVEPAEIASAVGSLLWTLRSSLNGRVLLVAAEQGAAAAAAQQQPSPAACAAFALLEPHLDSFSRRLLGSRLG